MSGGHIIQNNDTAAAVPVLKQLYRYVFVLMKPFSSPRAESARAVTGRRCPHSEEGEDFLMGQLNFFTKTAVTPE